MFSAFYAGETLSCANCGETIDLWEAVSKWIGEKFAFGSALTLAGARSTIVSVQLKPGETKEIDLTKAGVPEDAEVVSLSLTSGGSAFPMVVHGNDIIRDPFPPKFYVFGRELPHSPGQRDEGPLHVYAVWFVRREDDTVVRHLIDAARQYEARRFDAVVVPANIAAEAAITPVVTAALSAYGSKESREAFLRDGATYSHQLNILLAVVADLHVVRRMPENIRSGLNRLRKLRNMVGHSGRCDPQRQADAAQHLSSAIFGIEYAAFLRAKLKSPTTAAQQ
jgi:hypothetical protein